jgi:hypothetical protein
MYIYLYIYVYNAIFCGIFATLSHKQQKKRPFGLTSKISPSQAGPPGPLNHSPLPPIPPRPLKSHDSQSRSRSQHSARTRRGNAGQTRNPMHRRRRLAGGRRCGAGCDRWRTPRAAAQAAAAPVSREQQPEGGRPPVATEQGGTTGRGASQRGNASGRTPGREGGRAH